MSTWAKVRSATRRAYEGGQTPRAAEGGRNPGVTPAPSVAIRSKKATGGR
jgi:hypothetical protein